MCQQSRGVLVVIVVGAVGLLAGISFAQKRALLRPRMVAGEKTYIEMQWDQEFVWSGGELPKEGFKTTVHRVEGLWHEVESVRADGTAEVILTFERFALNRRSSDRSLEFDSDVAAAESTTMEFAQIFGLMLGESIRMEVNANGEVASFGGMDAIRKKVEAGAAGNPYLDWFSEMIANDAKKMLMETLLMFYPNREVGVGDTWERRASYRGQEYGLDFEVEQFGTENNRPVVIVEFTEQVEQKEPYTHSQKDADYTIVSKRGRGGGWAFFDVGTGSMLRAVEDMKVTTRMDQRTKDGKDATELKVEASYTLVTRNLSEAERKDEKRERAGPGG